jgi:hypothetical protein
LVVRADIDIATLAANKVNEDRAGVAGGLAWVIDGATDVIEAPLTTAATDASWIAETLDTLLRELAAALPPDLADVPAILTRGLQSSFRQAARRQPIGRHEHPSAAGLIVRTNGTHLDYVAVGDCSLIVMTKAGVLRIGVSEKDAGDLWVADALRAFRARYPEAAADAALAHLWPKLGAARWAMNQRDGYGVFSLTPTPALFAKGGSQQIAAGGHALLASDGLMRLVDVFRRYSAEEFLFAGVDRGLSSLAAEVRALEEADPDCVHFPRAKRYDDATGVLLSFTTLAGGANDGRR